MKLSPNQKLAGILEPVFAIRTEDDLGIGDTDGVRQMIDWCHQHGLNIFQTLPINETGDDHCPYNTISALAIDPVTLAVSPRFLPDLPQEKFMQIAPPRLLRELRQGPVNYAKVKALKRALLQAAFDTFVAQHFDAGTTRAGLFRRFREDHAVWLADYALYCALMEVNSGQPAWERWPAEHQTPALARAWLQALPECQRAELERKQFFFMYVQWLAFDQWQALKSYGESKQVRLMGDMPFGVGRASADVWANRALFDLDWSGGAPPEKFFKTDAFTEKWGQNWGMPDYRWDEMRRRNFDWWRVRAGNIQEIFHLCRVDHAPGFFRIYSFPWTPDRNAEFLPLDETQAAARTGGRLPGFKPFPDDTPEHKAANQQQGEELFRLLLEAFEDTVVVAEDLGVVPDYVPGVLQKLGIPGFRIPSFFREKDGRYSDPAKYPRLSLVQPATHDHAPLAAAWAGHRQNIDSGSNVEEHRRELRRLMDFAGMDDGEPPREFTRQLHEGYLRAVLQSNSWLAVVMITDVFGESIRFNTPGTLSSDNWTPRLPWTVKELDEDPVPLAWAETFARLVCETNRGHGTGQSRGEGVSNMGHKIGV
ncbi:MAG: 4-alpha-glucanotransferase [Limisphaerales bacterium]